MWPLLNLPVFERAIRDSANRRNLGHLRLTPHLARHGGISTDVFEQVLDLPTAKKRGQSSTDANVRRYEKHARLIAILNKLEADQREAATAAAACIGEKILKHTVLGKWV